MINGIESAVTGPDGVFTLDSMRSGKYVITAAKEHMTFTALRNQILSPTLAQLPPLTLSKYDICGSADSGEGAAAAGRTVQLQGPEGLRMTSKTDKNGAFCFSVPPGRYTITPALTAAEKAQGKILSPPSREISLTTRPFLSALFVQGMVSVSGRVRCLSSSSSSSPLCDASDGVKVLLAPVAAGGGGSHESAAAAITSPVVGNGEFALENVYPGAYKISAQRDGWCFEEGGVVEVAYAPVEDVVLRQSGFRLSCTLSHDMNISIAPPEEEGKGRTTFSLKKGTNDFCVPTPGIYRIRGDECLRFKEEELRFDTNAPRPLVLSATQYQIRGMIMAKSTQSITSVLVKKRSSEGAAETEPSVIEIAPASLLPEKDAGGAVIGYTYSFWAGEGERLEIAIKPNLESSRGRGSKGGGTKEETAPLLFYPRKMLLTVEGGGCPEPLPPFQGRLARFVTGKVSPAVANVKVEVFTSTATKTSRKGEGERPLAASALTDINGRYRAGPLYDDEEYIATASRQGYHMVLEEGGGAGGKGQPSTAQWTFNFKGLQLGELRVRIQKQGGGGRSRACSCLSAVMQATGVKNARMGAETSYFLGYFLGGTSSLPC
eukprot:jgi/Bigna1/143010/aug1.75_g17718